MSSSRTSRPIFAWVMYDFANSAFATSFLSVIFSVYFANVLVPPEGLSVYGFLIPGESLWGYLISSVMFCILFLAPSLGHRADERGQKRFFLILFIIVGGLATCALVGARPGHLGYAVVFAFLAILAYEMSFVFYNAFLNEMTEEASRGRISGLGFAFGYIGGGLCLALNMVMIQKPHLFGLSGGDATWPIRVSIGVVGLWWVIFSIPVFIWLFDTPRPASRFQADQNLFGLHAFRQLKHTLKDVFHRPDCARFLLAFLIYDDGIQTIILMASIFGAKVLGMNGGQLALCYLMIQFVAFMGALVLGRLADVWDHKSVILCTLVIFAGVVLWGLVIQHVWQFWILGAVVGLVMGGAQAASRSLFSVLIPEERAGEFFSLFSLVGKAASLVGPFVFGVVSQFYGIRAGVGSLLVFFVVGGAILFSVDEKRGRIS